MDKGNCIYRNLQRTGENMKEGQTERKPWCRLYFEAVGEELLLYESVEDKAMAAVIVEEPAAFVVTTEKHLICITGKDVDIDEVKKEAAKGKKANGFLGTVSKLYFADTVDRLI